MPLLRARPKIRLRAPREIVPGVPFELEARLETTRAVEIEWCELRVDGFELTNLGDSSRRHAIMDPRVARLSETRLLPPGLTSFACRAEIPEGAGGLGPSFVGTAVRTVYEAHVHASIAWWPDARATFALHVVLPPGAPTEGSPRVTSSRADGPSEGTPYLEVSVASDVVETGGVIEGALSLRGARGARFAIVAAVIYETVERGTPVRGTSYEVRVELPDVPDGSAVPFALRLPAQVTPSFAARTFRIGYWLEVDVRGSFHSLAKASLPLRVVSRGGATRAARSAPPRVGDARLVALFEVVAHARGHTLEVGPSLAILRNGIDARVERSLRADGTHLVMTASYPSLQLGLNVYEGGLVERLVKGRVATGDEAFDAAHVVQGREPEQVAAVLRRLAPAFVGFSVVRMNDESLTVSARTHANDRPSIEGFVERAEAILDALIVPPPMPSVFREVESEWASLASWLGARLEPGHARIRATYGSARVEVVTGFDEGVPASTTIVVAPELPFAVELDISSRSDVASLRGIAPEARTLLDRLARTGAVAVRARSTRIQIDAPLAGAFSPKKVRPIVETVLRLHEALKPTRGPFR